ncbi:MAG: hypothetical protein HQ528_07315 [Candidatus Marinimicrobia bacterium]|nr:hypothetical protein [Candidatus Neomarinimicrobiota bacterium]
MRINQLFKQSGILLFLIVIGLSTTPVSGQWLLNKMTNQDEKYADGPQKTWSENEYENYYRWRGNILNKQLQATVSDQVLRRQKAILTGNKISTEIWNFGSISSPGNITSDIVWEGLGYGYEFGPFICAEVEVAFDSHIDAYPKTDSNGVNITIPVVGTTSSGAVQPYDLIWETNYDTTTNRIQIVLDNFQDVHGPGIFNLVDPVSEQAGAAITISTLSVGDTLLLTGGTASALMSVLSIRTSSDYLKFNLTPISGKLVDVAGGNMILEILPKERSIYMARIISDGLVSLGGEVSPDQKEFWGWQPLAYSDLNVPYADPNSDFIPVSTDIDRDGDGKPDSWPDGWYNTEIKEYVWPGALRQGASNSDMESFFVVDDRTNREFEYYPFADDSSRRGLGLEIECRYYQWANPLAEDIIFLIYKVTNKSDKDLNDVIFGMWGDPHIGGPNNWADDLSFFDDELNIVYAWDEDGLSDVSGRSPGYFGYKFLESPGEPFDGLDNDNDGMFDESQNDGIDNDGDWNPDKHDVGIDGVPNTGDTGEGDGVPTSGDPFDIRKPGEPNFEWTDLDESDMIGLTGFAAPPFLSQNRISYDNYVYENFLTPGVFDTANSNTAGDYVFIYSSGPIDLPANETRRFSIALIIGEDYEDLQLNATTSQDIYEKNYQFAKPPNKPNVVAVPGDERVTLYWDSKAEDSIDPISESKDFEGYVIYRSTDPQFLDQQTITDSYGSGFLLEPLKMVTGASAKFDLDNEFSGLSSIPFPGRGVYYHLGNNTGLRHSFIDSNNVINGQTYYYTVVSFDHGSDSLEIPPTECSRTVTINPESNEVLLDINTIQIVPRLPAAGFNEGHVIENMIHHVSGIATGSVEIVILDGRTIKNDNLFNVSFQSNPIRYTVEDLSTIVDTLFIRLDQYVRASNQNINDTTFALKSLDGSTIYIRDVDYSLIPGTGQVLALSSGNLLDNTRYRAEYRYFPILESQKIKGEEGNPIFNGMTLSVNRNLLRLNTAETRWTEQSQTNYTWKVVVAPYSSIYAADYEIRFFESLVDSSSLTGTGHIKTNFEIWDVTRPVSVKKRFIILEEETTKDSLYSNKEKIMILRDDEGFTATWQIQLIAPDSGVTIPPAANDIFLVRTQRPFSEEDVYQFETKASIIDLEVAKKDLDEISVVPNPYVVTNVIEQLDYQNPRNRGPHRLYFNHLPQKCTIKIYTVTGELVTVLDHDSPMDNGIEYWDLTTRDNFPIAYGVYIYHVDAGVLGEKIGRLGVIK